MNESMTSPIILIFWLTHFNPRSYERSDALFVRPASVTNGFNPRSYERSDEARKTDLQTGDVSIHAPTKGATIPENNPLAISWFQSTLLRKERPCPGGLF